MHQHIHAGSRKRVKVHEIDPDPQKKRARIKTVVLHSESLKAGQESIVEMQQRTVSTPPLNTSNTRQRKRKNIVKTAPSQLTAPKRILTAPSHRVRAPARSKPTRSKKTPGWKFHLQMDAQGHGWELAELANENDIPPVPVGIQETTLRLLTITHQIFGEKCISSNRAEIFNSFHDQRMRYQGRKTGALARRDYHAWQAAYFYPFGSQAMLRANHFHFPLTLVCALLPWTIAEVEIH